MSTTDPKEIFPASIIEKIVAAVGAADRKKIDIMATQLRDLPGAVSLFGTLDAAGAPSARIAALGSVARACAGVLEALERDMKEIASGLRQDVMVPQIVWFLALEIDPKHPEWIIRDRQADQSLERCLEGVRKLKEAAEAGIAQAQAKKKPGRGGARRRPDRVLNNIAIELFEIYEFASGRTVATSVDRETKEPGGPLVRFFELCLPELEWKLSPKAIRSLIERVRKHGSREPASI